MKRDFIIFQPAGMAVLRQVEVGDEQRWLSSRIRSGLCLI
jgi:hypothetical protein